jgi:hypothetical protein
MHPDENIRDLYNRRDFLSRCGVGLGSIALSSLLGKDLQATAPASGTAKRVIYLHMAGSPAAQDTFDYKPKLQQAHGQLCPKEFIENKRLAFIKGHPTLLGSPYKFHSAGKSGTKITELMPHFAKIIDDVTLIRSMTTTEFNHAPAQLLMHTGSPQFGAPSLGSWASWGLGSLNNDLPTFVVMVSGGVDPSGGKSLWQSGFLPSHHQAAQLRSQGDPILFLKNPAGMSAKVRRRSLDALHELNQLEFEQSGDPETLSRIKQYELAWRMQSSVPDVMDIAKEPKEVHALYGSEPGKASFANNCLLARRLVEKGVRFVQLYDWGWDLHGTNPSDDLMSQFPKKCKATDRASAALVIDLKRRGLLKDTLVIWGGEFGRTSMNEKRNGSKLLGRDHHPDCFSLWMAGGGAKPGLVYGSTDELGYAVHENPFPVRDFQATIMHMLGLDPHKTSYPYQGLDQRFIGPADTPRVRKEVLA